MSNNAIKDGNFVNSLTVVLDTNGKTIILASANPTTHALNFNEVVTGIDYGPSDALKDDNDVSTLLAVSSVDFKTPVVVYGDSNNNVLIET